MSAVTILAHADHGAEGVGDAVDVADFTVLRLETTAAPNYGDSRWEAIIDLETAPAATGPWRQLTRLADHRVPVKKRSIVNDHDAFVRVRWSITSHALGVALSFPIGVTGEGKPDAAG